jgi:GNAT superfamily N-acetyltransferase
VDIVLRPATVADEEFLFAVFVYSRDFNLSIFPEPQRSALMQMQFRGQQYTYVQRYPTAEHHIVALDGCDAGRIWVAETEDAISVLDIALLPRYRNRGIGRQLYVDLMNRARATGKPLRATISTENPGSLRFHERLGFRRSGGDGMYISMVFLDVSSSD